MACYLCSGLATISMAGKEIQPLSGLKPVSLHIRDGKYRFSYSQPFLYVISSG
jgi:hypothetical protein